MKRRRRLQRGFTLVEMIVATLLLAIGVAACMAAISASTRTSGVASEYSTAALLGDRHFSELMSDPNGPTTGEQSGDFSDHPEFHWRQSIDQSDITGLLRISLTIEWQNGTGVRSAQFVTYEPQPQTTS